MLVRNLVWLRSAACLAALLGMCGCRDREPASTMEARPAPEGGAEVRPASPPEPGQLEAHPLPAPAPASSEALFTRLEPAQCGIDLVNPIQHDHPMAYLYASAMGCGGVAVGDVDGDGRPDLYFTGGPVPNRLYRQVGELKFEDVTATAGVDGGGAWSTGASLIDLDNDGDLDLYVCNYDSPNLLYLNQGDGTFVESARQFGLDFTGAGHTPAFCDYDLDGDLDLYLMTNLFYDPRGKITEPIVGMVNGQPKVLPAFEKFYGITAVREGPQPGQVNVEHDTVGQPDRLLRNNGDGSFTEMSQPGQFVGKGNAVVWWDPDGDRRPDLFVANDFKDPDFLLKSQPDGTFREVIRESVPHTTWFSMGADSADLNNDGLPDLMVADMSGTNHFKQKVGMGAMSDSAEFLNTANPRQYMRNTVFINSGTSRLQEAAHMCGLANSDWTWTVRLSDLDNDGRVDVFVTNGMAVNLNVSDNPAAVQALPGETEWAKHQRAGTGPLLEQNLAFRNKGDLVFDDVSKPWGLDHVGMSYAATAADLDRDGDLELIVANLEEPVSIYRNDSSEGARATVELHGRESNRNGLGATVRIETADGPQMRFLTLARGYMASGEARLHFGLGTATRIDRMEVTWPSGHRQSFQDLDINHHFVITEPTGPAAPVAQADPKPLFQPMASSLREVSHRETPFDDFAVQPLLPNKLSQLGPGMAWGDIDGDGDHDLFLGGARGSAGQLLRNDGNGAFTPVDTAAFAADAGCEDMGVLFLDSDRDGDLDLYVVSGGVELQPGAPTYQDRLYLNDGSGSYTKAPVDALPALSDSGSVVSASDVDQDGDLDLFVGGRVVPGQYPLPARSHLLRNDEGRFTDVTAEWAPSLASAGLVTSALWSDADGDGRDDLFVTYEWGPVRYYRNTGEGLEDQTEAAGIHQEWGWWNSIAAGDVDADGDIDYALGNFGLNTKYHPSTEHPAYIFYGDFDGTGKMRCVEAEFEENTLYPVRGRSCSSQAMPFLLDKFGTFTEFAKASLPEIYPRQRLKEARQFAANQLRSGLLLNDGSGRFEFRPLPRIAQIAPAFGMELLDVNGDSHLDLYLVQNFYTPQAETGRMAGGLSQLLLGDGSGEFSAVRADRSGLVVPGDAKSLARADLDSDGWPDFVVAQNDGPLAVFRNNGNAQGDILTVRLAGHPGNPTAVGARVTVHLVDGSRRVQEVHAGAGYLSQGPPDLSFGLGSSTAQRIDVQWPTGETSSLESLDPKAVVELAQPE